jgi:predicted GIY-YIG superfamily endonuclease
MAFIKLFKPLENTSNMIEISWEYCQHNSDLILASGIELLINKPKTSFKSTHPSEYGNYLITDMADEWRYIGEAKKISERVKQHAKERSSTFFKNYLKLQYNFPRLSKGLQIDDFGIRSILTSIGRKEMEEFGIVNIPANLNKFQKGKRAKYSGNTDQGIWDEIQSCSQELLEQGEKELLASKPFAWPMATVDATAGLYWVEHASKGLIYIGESSNIFERYVTHSGTTYFSALRRHVGENILGFQLHVKNGKKKYFTDKEDVNVSNFLAQCTFRPFAINFGRYELEEYLIRKHRPLLNRKENK